MECCSAGSWTHCSRRLQVCGVSSLPDVSLATVTDVVTLSICLTVCDVANTIQALSKRPVFQACRRAATCPALVACLPALWWAALPDLLLCPAFRA